MDTGLGFVQPLFFIGVVENRNDPRAEGRIQVRAFGVHGSNRDIPTEDLPWATLIIGNHDVNFTPPPLNSWVFGFFIDGRDAQQPMVLGLIPTQATALVNPALTGWGSIPAEDYDRQSQGSRPRDLGLSPMSKLATGEFLNETYNEALEINRVRNIPIAGGGARNHYTTSNGNIWGNDLAEGFGADNTTSQTRQVPATEQLRIDGLDNDTEFQTELNRLKQKYGITREQLYGIIAGESNYNPKVINRFGYAGFFQFGTSALADINSRNGTRHTPVSISRMSPVEQLKVYDKYLDRWNFKKSSGLGIMQAAPAFASRSGNTEVYPVGSSEWNANSTWRGPDGRITVDSINAYYNRRNPPIISETLESVDPGLLKAVNDQRQNKAEEIRIRIAAIDVELETTLDPIKAKTLLEERTTLEEELRRLRGSGSTEATAGEAYSGYASPSVDPSVATYWEEPPSGYAAKYPYNRVIETASGHSIELDDTPGAERIMIWHHSGSYIQLTGTSTTHKNMSDTYQIDERNHHVFIGGNNVVTIEGDSYVLVKGNKVEEIEGDYKQIVHGNIQVGGGGRVEINGADRTDIRSSCLSLESNVENLDIRTGKNITFESGETINFNSKNIRVSASETMNITGERGLFLSSSAGDLHLKSQGNMFINPNENLFMRTEGGSISVQSDGSIGFSSSGSFISFQSSSYMSIGASEELLIESRGGGINVSAKNKMSLKSDGMFLNSSGGDMNLNVGANLNTNSIQLNVKSGTVYLESDSALDIKGENVKIGGGSKVSINASVVAIDDIIQMANGASDNPEGIQANADVKAMISSAQFNNEISVPSAESGDKATSASISPVTQSETQGPPPPPDRAAPNPVLVPEDV